MSRIVPLVILFRVYAAWVTDEFSNQQTALVVGLIVCAELKAPMFLPALAGLGFVFLRQKGYLDVDPVETSPEWYGMLAAMAVGFVAVIATVPRALPLIMAGGTVYLAYDAARILGMFG